GDGRVLARHTASHRVVHERRIREAFLDATPYGVPALVRRRLSPRGHEPGVLFGIADGLHVEIAVDDPDPAGIVSVDDVQQLIEGVFHGIFPVTPRSLYRSSNWFPALS